jgi:Tfp pilus assembly protein PilX
MNRLRACRSARGAVGIALVVAMVILQIIIVVVVVAGARQHDLHFRRVETIRAFYAAEAGMNMAMRELMDATDHDGDGGVGTISNDGITANDPALGTAQVFVGSAPAGTQVTLTSRGRDGSAERAISTVVELMAAGSAMIAYGQNGGSGDVPRYRIWDGSSWGAEQQANSVGGSPQWIVLRGSSTGTYLALGTLDDQNDVEVQIFDGASWSGVFQATASAGATTSRLFDMAYEQLSGELLLVYKESGASDVRYRTYSGGAWSAEFSYTMTGGNLTWLRLVPKAGSDEIMVIAQSDHLTNHSRAAFWNGSAFVNQSPLSELPSLGMAREHGDGAFESSGEAMAAYSVGVITPGYRTVSGGAWSSTLLAPSVGGVPNWTRVVGNPFSNEILYGTLDASLDINVNVWNGSSWGVPLEAETNTATSLRRGFDLAYEKNGTEALLVYDDNSNTLKYRTWSAGAWSAENDGPNGGNPPIQCVQAIPGPVTGHIFVTYTTDNEQIRTVLWNGAGFGAATIMGVSSAPKQNEAFMVATVPTSSVATRLLAWTEIEP